MFTLHHGYALGYCVILLVGIGLVLLVIRLIIRWRTQEERLALVKYQREINQAHIDFVTNISHEVRTPLAMVYAPLKELAKENNLNEHERGWWISCCAMPTACCGL